MRKLPPLNSIRVFEIAALHLSFSKAAASLNITQGAVSKQVKLLEEYLGFQLFERLHQSLALTTGGKKYLAVISKALEIIENSTAAASEKSTGETIRINILPTLSSRWLVPMLADFYKKYPNINIEIDTGDGEVNLTKQNADIAIRAAKKPSWPKYYSSKIMAEKLLPVYSAKLAKEMPVTKQNDLKKHRLLKHTTRKHMWPEYLNAIGANENGVKYGSGFEHFFVLIEAVRDGLGVALIPEFLIKNELKNKEFIAALNNNFESPYKYYFICRKNALGQKKIASFYNWLLSKPKGG